MDQWQYLIVLGACLLVTAPLEFFGAGVYRQPLRLFTSVAPVAAVFVVWDAVAIFGHVWTYNPRYITGIDVGFSIPVEELLFFIVIPVCGLLTYSAVSTILGFLRRRVRVRDEQVRR